MSRPDVVLWREAIAASELGPLEKLIAYTMAIHMNRWGNGCHANRAATTALRQAAPVIFFKARKSNVALAA